MLPACLPALLPYPSSSSAPLLQQLCNAPFVRCAIPPSTVCLLPSRNVRACTQRQPSARTGSTHSCATPTGWMTCFWQGGLQQGREGVGRMPSLRQQLLLCRALRQGAQVLGPPLPVRAAIRQKGRHACKGWGVGVCVD